MCHIGKGGHSWSKAEDIPWNVAEKRDMTPVEGVKRLAAACTAAVMRIT